MRTQQLLALSGLLLAGNVAIASKLDHDDVPNRCWEACGSVVNTAQRCDHQHDNDDSAEIQCICDWDAAKTQVPLCAACIDKYDRDYDTDDDNDDDDDDDDNEALEIIRSCNFSTTTYNASATTSTGSTTTTGLGAAATTTGASSTSGSTGSGISTSDDSGSGSAGASATSPDTSSGSSDPTQDSASATPTNAAAGMNAPGAISMVALAGLIPLAWL
ncbi:hypothetical protein N7509_006389 [Penicillium cosmopolitanum]|uniref:GPI anchored protein n=1 Tax=Penicillium cosmopolitanum TaxID=1131564 RepID=A0A9W9W4G5_9EURO|nr:uncharacterized protein N7509_006389 [Penicillium cosmopolitanum]KAJ5398276.1 hypothetical protein N7509_006389 [Penicillium cosmopolitanum]